MVCFCLRTGRYYGTFLASPLPLFTLPFLSERGPWLSLVQSCVLSAQLWMTMTSLLHPGRFSWFFVSCHSSLFVWGFVCGVLALVPLFLTRSPLNFISPAPTYTKSSNKSVFFGCYCSCNLDGLIYFQYFPYLEPTYTMRVSILLCSAAFSSIVKENFNF